MAIQEGALSALGASGMAFGLRMESFKGGWESWIGGWRQSAMMEIQFKSNQIKS